MCTTGDQIKAAQRNRALPYGIARFALDVSQRNFPPRGFMLLEVLVAMLILLFGLLGLAGLMARANGAELESYQRVQALILAQDMVDRMNANRKQASCYSKDGAGMTLGSGFTGTPTCAGGTGEAAQAVADMTAWDGMLKGSSEVSGGANFGAMIGARGCITQVDAANRIYRISVAWQGLVSTTEQVDTCGKTSYGPDEARRRVITMTVRIAHLS